MTTKQDATLKGLKNELDLASIETELSWEQHDRLVKSGRRNSAQDLAKLQAAHDALVGAGASCPVCDPGEGDLADSKRYVSSKIKFKALASEDGTSTFSFYAAAFGNLDLVGDIVDPGAFDKTLAEWRASGKPIPVVFSHSWDRAFSIVGHVDPNDVTTDKKGLLIKKAVFDVDTNPEAAQVARLINSGTVDQASFSYDTRREEKRADGNHLLEVELIEVGPCLKGANPLAGGFAPAKSLSSDQMIADVKAKLARDRQLAELESFIKSERYDERSPDELDDPEAVLRSFAEILA